MLQRPEQVLKLLRKPHLKNKMRTKQQEAKYRVKIKHQLRKLDIDFDLNWSTSVLERLLQLAENQTVESFSDHDKSLEQTSNPSEQISAVNVRLTADKERIDEYLNVIIEALEKDGLILENQSEKTYQNRETTEVRAYLTFVME